MNEILKVQFPQERLDEMTAEAARFNAADNRPLAWRFDGPNSKWDAAESAYLSRQLEYIRPGVIEASFPDLMASTIFPFNTEIDNASTSYTVIQSRPTGTSLVTQNMAGIIPRVDEALGETNYKIFAIMSSYGYSIQEARTAMKAGRPLNANRAMLCRQTLLRDLEEIAFNGHAVGLKGALTLTGTDTYTVPSDGVGGLKTFASKSPDQVLRDLNTMASQVVTATLGIEVPNILVLAMTTYEHVASTRVGDGTSMSILNYFKGNTAHIKRVERTYQAETAGSGGVTRSMAFEQNPAKLEFVVPVPYEQFAPGTDQTGLHVVTVAQVRTAGMVLHREKSVIYADGF